MTNGISRIRNAGVSALVALTATAGLVPLASSAGAASNLTTTRFAGVDRFDTAKQISAAFGSAGTVVIARGDTFPDALAGSYIAGQNSAVILLTRTDSVPDSTLNALTQTGATKAVILGGTTAISSSVETTLRNRGLTVTRIGGATRYDTAQMVAEQPGAGSVGSLDSNKTAIVVSGANFPDALSGGPVAYAAKFPVILTPPTSLGSQAKAAIANLGIKNVLILGGPAAVSQAVEDALKAAAPQGSAVSVTRIQGANRAATAVEVAKFSRLKLGFSAQRIGVARGDDFADALAYGPLGGKSRAQVAAQVTTPAPNNVLLTTSFNTAGTEIINELTSLQPSLTQLEIIGGLAAITGDVQTQLETAAKGTGSASGATYTFTQTSVAPGGTIQGTVTGANLGAITVSGCGLTNQSVRTGEGNFTITVPATQGNGTCTLTFTNNFTNGSPSTTTTQAVSVTNTPTTVTLTNNSVAQGGNITGNISGPATIGAVTVSGCGLTNQTVRTGPGSFSVTIPATTAAGSCSLTFTLPDTAGGPTQSATQPVTVTTAGGGGGGVGGSQVRTAGPDLVSVSIVDGVLNNGIPNTIKYTFDEDVAVIAPAPGTGGFKLGGYDSNVALTGPIAPGTATVDGTDTKSVNVQFLDTTDVRSFTIGIVDSGTVRDSGGQLNTLASKPLTGSSFSSTSGQTAGPDLVSATANSGSNQITFCFDEKINAGVNTALLGYYDTNGTRVPGAGAVIATPTENCAVIGNFAAPAQVSQAIRFFADAGAVVGAQSLLTNPEGHKGGTTAAPDLTGVTKVAGTPNQYDFAFDAQVTTPVLANFKVYTDDGTAFTASALSQPNFNTVRATFNGAPAISQNNVDLVVLGAVADASAVSNNAAAVPATLGAFPIARTGNAGSGFTDGPDLLTATFDPNGNQVIYSFDSTVSDAPGGVVPAQFFVVNAGGTATSAAGGTAQVLGKTVTVTYPAGAAGAVASAAGAGVTSTTGAQTGVGQATAALDFNGNQNSPGSVGGGPAPGA